MSAIKRPGLGTWNPFKQHVAEELVSGDFVGSHSVLIAAGPPRLSDVSTLLAGGITQTDQSGTVREGAQDPVYPLGIVQSASVTQSKQLQRLFEIGSYRSYFIPGRVVGAINLGVVLFDGPSVMRALYARYQITSTDGRNLLSGDSQLVNNPDRITVNDSPGSNENFYINLSSDLFNKPIGLLFYLTDNDLNPYGAFYCEDCYTQGHNMSLNSGSVVLVEGVSIQFDRVVPVKVSAPAPPSSQSR